ncbi:hypothetical protein C0J29_27065 [Mycobacterium paragordonae]|uniref:DUF3987 domain-containing protein n=1 Tax=Mycobacterium paragordonae TaxID=1389713 RepID=A0ABQ1CAZ8_9MYCO|nr:hypothetical protein [Mycobacterium paragordonae]AYE97910.1 hypothetical protein C0J29_27065 [Mycobacterium paragordonae]GFG81655.1 hypothetical protein MPRG_49310 [Mycobacterium paragordonae]
MIDTEQFFLESGSDQLAKIYRWARARYAAPWAVFFAVLLRVAASVGPHVQLPGVIGGRASLNLLVAFVSASGGGKGISDKVGRMAWPASIVELPIGSGEGIAAAFKRPDKPDEDNEPITAAVFNIPEIDTLSGIASRQGSILLAQLKSMAMGEQLGQSNASKATSRIVPAHSYRCCLSVGAQPGHTGVIFNDTTGGTPQRFLWSPTTDPEMPDTNSPDPAPLDTALPLWKPAEDGAVEIIYGPPEITQTVIAAHIARQRGDADPLNGHWMLTRCKVAALLAIMHQRSVVSQTDWEMSATVMAVSDQTREWIVNEALKADRAKIRDRAMARARGEEFVSDHKLLRAKSAVIRWLGRDTELAANQLRSKLKADLRDHFGAATAELVAEGLIAEIHVDRGARYRLNKEVQGVPPVQGIYPQLTEGVPPVQGVPSSPGPTGQGDQCGQGPLLQLRESDPVGQGDQLEDTAQPNFRSPDPSGPSSEDRRSSAQISEEPVALARVGVCQRCYVSLPKASTAAFCDDCIDAPERPVPPKKTTNEYALRVVHNGTITADDHRVPSERERAG